MPLVLADRVQETTTTTGTGTITLAGAVAGFQSFAVIGDTNTTYYAITSGTAWEVGIGTYSTTGPTLARTTIISSSNSGSAISLSGTSNVFVTLPGDKALVDLADRPAKTYLVGTELMLAEEAGVQYQIPASAVLGSSFITLGAGYILANSTATQQIFNSSTNGALTLPTGIYLFELMMYLAGMSSTSGNLGFDLKGAGTAALNEGMLHTVGVDNNSPGSPLPQNGIFSNSILPQAPIHTFNAATVLASQIRGRFTVATAGTIIPSVYLTTASAASVSSGSYFLVRRVAPTSTLTVGNWS